MPTSTCCPRPTHASTRQTSRSTGSPPNSPGRHPWRSSRCRSHVVACASPTADTAGAITTLEKAVGVAQQNEFSDMELVAHGLLAEVFKSLGRFEEALLHREACTRIHEQIFNRDTDLRIKTLQISHDTLAARDQAELLRVRTTELEELVTARTQDLEEQHYEAFERLAAIAEYRDPDSGEHSHAGRRAGRRARPADRRGPGLGGGAATCRATARRRQGRCARLHSAEARLADRRRVRDHEDPHDGRRHESSPAAGRPCCNWLPRSPSRITSDGTAAAIPAAWSARTSR